MTMPTYKTAAVGGAPTVTHVGVGPRNPMGLPKQPTGAKTPPTPPQPMSAAAAYSSPVLPGPRSAGFRFLPSSPTPAMMGQPPPVAVTPTPLTSRTLPTVIMGGAMYQGGMGSAIKGGGNVYQAGPAPTPPAPTTPPNPNYTAGQMPITMTGSLLGG